ncbi:hypothetical protein [Gimesia aquarii]|uniref:Uncharacterized protein n=1 Tax=Gimesia aquarii TaxID=2527964 RepID=A0A517WQL2_9PLAN|nr:hypothetical protein [Gimesia aquarii]QDU07537.1 hypothetical protein V202x_08940 [Gimesia aquarii]
MNDNAELSRQCPCCGLVLLLGTIFDAAAKEEEFGPILGIKKNVDPANAKAGYIGIGSLRLENHAPEFYSCPRCKADPSEKVLDT